MYGVLKVYDGRDARGVAPAYSVVGVVLVPEVSLRPALDHVLHIAFGNI